MARSLRVLDSDHHTENRIANHGIKRFGYHTDQERYGKCWPCSESPGHKSSLPGKQMSGPSYCCSDKLSLIVHHGPEKVGRTSSIFGRRRSCSLLAISGVESFA
jgi:hypothetical protein